MRRTAPAFAAMALALGLTTPLIAQEDAEPGYVEVSQLELAPADVDGFLDMVKTVRDAAVETSLDARFAWDVYRRDNRIYFVSWHQSMVDFEDPEAFVRAFQGTSVANRVMAAFERTNSMHFQDGLSEVSRARPDMSYMPASPAMMEGEQGGVYVLRQWPAGDDQAYEESVKDFMGMLTEMGGPYPVFVSQNMIGKGGYIIAVPFDNLANFYGANSLQTGLAASGMASRWAEHEAAHQKLLSDVESFEVMYLPEHSYRPPGM